jgi:hypothetical protein
MAIQPMSREALFKKMADVVNNLPTEQLPQLWQQMNAWESAFAQAGNDDSTSHSADGQAVVEFVVPARLGAQKPLIRLPLRSTTPIPAAIMEVGEAADEADTFMQQLRANIEWWNQHYAQICNDASLAGHYVAIANGEIFAGDSYMAAYAQVRQVHPNGVPYILLLPSAQEAIHHAN